MCVILLRHALLVPYQLQLHWQLLRMSAMFSGLAARRTSDT